jgi:hypothetical protein
MRRLTRREIAKRIDAIDPEDAIRGRAEIDAEAREELETVRGAAYTDAEWAEAKRNLFAFMAIVAEWTKDDEAATR